MWMQRFIKRHKDRLDRRLEPVYAFLDSKFAYTSNDKVLFLDCGANLGQGYAWFSEYFHHSNVSFELFEPNPNCLAHLQSLDCVINCKVKLNPFGIGTEDGFVKFFGLDSTEGGALSQGGSIVKTHNSNHYSASDASSIDVKIVDFVKYLEIKSSQFNKIIVKMDIEGAEVDLLEKMIADNSIRFINVLYVEFHSQYQKTEESVITQAREQRIIDAIRHKTQVKLRIWH
jgi:FkbM family methyltransferase